MRYHRERGLSFETISTSDVITNLWMSNKTQPLTIVAFAGIIFRFSPCQSIIQVKWRYELLTSNNRYSWIANISGNTSLFDRDMRMWNEQTTVRFLTKICWIETNKRHISLPRTSEKKQPRGASYQLFTETRIFTFQPTITITQTHSIM